MHTGLMVIGALLLTACAATAPPPRQSPAPGAVTAAAESSVVTPPPPLALPKVAPADLGGDLQLNQHLTISRGQAGQLGEEHEIDVALAVEGQRLKLAAVGLGLRLITLDYDGRTVSEQRHPLLPAVVNGERILRDMVLTWWPLDSLRPLLPAGWTVVEADAQRSVLWQGRPVIVIRYDKPAGQRWLGGAQFENLQHGYRLGIISSAA